MTMEEGRRLAYSSGNFGKALVFGGADLTIIFLLTDVLELAASTAGMVMLVALCGDLLFDLLAARVVIDLRRSGRGYRWLVTVAAPPCATAFALLYAMPLLGARESWMIAGALLLFRGAYAMVDVPHNALMAQITSDSRARGRVSGYRLFFSTTSALAIATILTPLVQKAGQNQAFGALAQTGVVAGLLFTLTMILCACTSGTGRAQTTPSPALKHDGLAVPLADPMVLGMGLLALLTGFAAPTFGRMLLYTISYVVDRPDMVRTLLLAMTTGQFAGIMIWTALTGRFAKSHLLAMGHATSAIGLLLFFLCMNTPAALMGCTALIGFGFASVFMLPWGLLADAVDVVEWRHGRRLETGLFAFYLVIVKASGAASTAVIGWTLGWAGYVPGQPQSAIVHGAMMSLGIGVPLAGALCSLLLMRRFDLGHARHARLLTGLTRRRQSGAEPVSGLKRGLAKSIGDGSTFAGGCALSAHARHSMSRSIDAPAAVRS